MTAFARLKVTALLVLVLVGLVTGIGWAGSVFPAIVKIDDLTEGPPTVTTVPPGLQAIISIGPEFVHFTLPLPLSGPQSTTTYVDLFEGSIGGSPVSDRLLFTYHAGDLFVDVQFASDPATITLPGGAINQFNNVENGNFVSAGTFSIGENLIYSFQVRSDVADVPGPATLLLLGSGLAALASTSAFRRRTK